MLVRPGQVLNGTNAEPYAFKAVRPVKAALFTAWYFCAFAGELAAFAVVSFDLASLRNFAWIPSGSSSRRSGSRVGWPASGESFRNHSSIYDLQFPVLWQARRRRASLVANDPPGPGAIPATFIFARFFAWAALCCLDLPQGILPVGSLGRPMGLTVLRQNFLEPVAACQEALACLSSHTGGIFECGGQHDINIYTRRARLWPLLLACSGRAEHGFHNLQLLLVVPCRGSRPHAHVPCHCNVISQSHLCLFKSTMSS